MDAVANGIVLKVNDKVFLRAKMYHMCANHRAKKTDEDCIVEATIQSILFEVDEKGNSVWKGRAIASVPVDNPDDSTRIHSEIEFTAKDVVSAVELFSANDIDFLSFVLAQHADIAPEYGSLWTGDADEEGEKCDRVLSILERIRKEIGSRAVS